jgi:hypothetical protein
MNQKHSSVTVYSSISGGKDYDERNRTRQQQISISGATDLDRMAPSVGFLETSSHDPSTILFGELRSMNHAATSGRRHCLAGPAWAQQRVSSRRGLTVAGAALCLSLAVLGAGCLPSQDIRPDDVADMPNPMLNAAYSEDADVAFVMEPRTAIAHQSGRVNFASESASRRMRDMAHWIVSSKDNLGMPFAIIDKVNAKVYVFSEDGQLYGAAPVLLGLAKGDYSAPDIGDRPLSSIPPAERTTPAGRFVSTMGTNHKGKHILWLDYEQSLSMHAVVKGTPKDRRADRLATPTPLDNRISFGCINVPVDFFENTIQSKFSGNGGIVYILPETRAYGKL